MTNTYEGRLPDLSDLPFDAEYHVKLVTGDRQVQALVTIEAYNHDPERGRVLAKTVYYAVAPLANFINNFVIENAISDLTEAFEMGLLPDVQPKPEEADEEDEEEQDDEESSLLHLIDTQLPVWLSGESEQSQQAYTLIRDAVAELLVTQKDDLAKKAVKLIETTLGPEKTNQFANRLLVDVSVAKLHNRIKSIANQYL